MGQESSHTGFISLGVILPVLIFVIICFCIRLARQRYSVQVPPTHVRSRELRSAGTGMTIDSAFAAQFAAQFADTWRTTDLAKHEALWSEDIVLTQPMMGTLRGKPACREAFQRLFTLVPDLHADVHTVGHGEKQIYIEFTLSGTYGGKPIAWDAVDRFTFTNGLIAERVSYFDATPLVLKLVFRPSGWDRLARTGAALFKRWATQLISTVPIAPAAATNRQGGASRPARSGHMEL